jgi:hypothetical protein
MMATYSANLPSQLPREFGDPARLGRLRSRYDERPADARPMGYSGDLFPCELVKLREEKQNMQRRCNGSARHCNRISRWVEVPEWMLWTYGPVVVLLLCGQR